MKLIKAYLRMEMFENVRQCLCREGYQSMTVMEAEGMGSYCDPEDKHPSLRFPALHSKMVKLEMIAEDDHTDPIVEIIQNEGGTGHKGDGVIIVLPIQRLIKVRTGEEQRYSV